MRLVISLAVFLGFGLAVCQARGEVRIDLRPLYHSEDFAPGDNTTFCLEELECLNGLTELDWDVVREEIIRGMKAKGYKYREGRGTLRVSFGSFPPNDVSHPVVGLYLKLRVGTRLQDLPKWTLGAMAHGDYTAKTMKAMASRLVAEVPECGVGGASR